MKHIVIRTESRNSFFLMHEAVDRFSAIFEQSLIMKKPIICLGLLLLFSSLVYAQSKKGLEGSIIFNFQATGGGPEFETARLFMPTGYVFKVKGASMRMSMQGGMVAAMVGDLIVNAKTNEQYMVMPATKTAMRLPQDEAIKPGAGQADFAVTEGGDARKIQGYDCFHYIIELKDQPGASIELWLTEEIQLKIPRKSNTSPLAQVGKYGLNGFPLRMLMLQEGIQVSIEAIEIVREPLDDRLFEVPKGYTVTDFNRESLDMGADND